MKTDWRYGKISAINLPLSPAEDQAISCPWFAVECSCSLFDGRRPLVQLRFPPPFSPIYFVLQFALKYRPYWSATPFRPSPVPPKYGAPRPHGKSNPIRTHSQSICRVFQQTLELNPIFLIRFRMNQRRRRSTAWHNADRWACSLNHRLNWKRWQKCVQRLSYWFVQNGMSDDPIKVDVHSLNEHEVGS